MLLVFFALTTGVVILIRRSLTDKLILLLTTAPIAVLANVIRITLTGVLYASAASHWADLVFHDLAGWFMMPMALGLLWLELHILSRVFVEVVPVRHVPPLGFDRVSVPAGQRSRNRPERGSGYLGERIPILGPKS
jgi:exosortase/archaeosortase family protein